MKMIRTNDGFKVSVLSSVGVGFALLTMGAQAEIRQHDAHEHGHAILNAAQEGNELEVSIEVPAMDMVGFEHQPETDKQRALIKQIEAALLKGNDVITFAKAADCHLEKAKVESALLSEHEEHGDHHEEHGDHHEEHSDHHEEHGDHHEEHGDHHEEHGDHHEEHSDHHEEHSDHHEEHGDHHEEHGDHHAEHGDHHADHDDHEGHGGHSEFEITYHFHCEQPNELSGFELKLFNVSSSLQEVDASWFGETSVKKAELSPKQPVMSF